MTSSVIVRGLRKKYRLFSGPGARLKEAVHPLRKTYHREIWALNGIDFEVERGSVVGILGRNGSGKSTLLQLLAGTLSPTEGEVITNGRIAAMLDLGAGFDPVLTGRENVRMQGEIAGLSLKEVERRIPLIQEFADIGEFFDYPVKTYSAGMFARLAFSAAIQGEPDILIIDEVLGVGDARFQEKCMHRIQEMRKAGMTIVFVSHNTDQILRLCGAALLLEGGQLICAGPVRFAVDAYHSILYGHRGNPVAAESGAADALPAPVSDIANSQADALAEFIASPHPLLPGRPYYNPGERRLSNQMAEIRDIMATASGGAALTSLHGGEELTFHLKVSHFCDLQRAHLGWGVTTTEGMMVSGSNTLLSAAILPPVTAGDQCVYSMRMTLPLNAGDYFVNIGVMDWKGDWVFLDVRRAVIHIKVQGTDRCTGYIDAATEFEKLEYPC